MPACPHCGSLLRPDVVWFGESLPKKKFTPKFADKAGFDKGDGKPAGKFKKPKRATAKS